MVGQHSTFKISQFAFQCPCLLKQAIVDRGRYQPDFECDQDGNTACELHQNAKHCVTTGIPK